ncbi:STM4014 family protein [Bacillus sp. FJAT-27264]|uniref:STM4014 family protein n=1 Tax=Paenibacillus sp. (strain DSM 101736 / FJAT-27264) TaxID=1850362 RepID=UPI0025703374|nr:STM4014 family protein [Bacillus sp. FJAT-27264]
MMTRTGVIRPLRSNADMQPLIVIGHPGDRRTEGIRQARERLGLPPAIILPYAGLLQGRHITELLAEQQPAMADAAGRGSVSPLLRLDSPGGSFESERALIALGAPDTPDASDALHPGLERQQHSSLRPGTEQRQHGSLPPNTQQRRLDSLPQSAERPQPGPLPLSVKAALRLQDLPGVLHHPSQWFRGYCRLLGRLKREAAEAWPGAEWLNDPAEIIAMTDKRETQRILAAAGVPVPRPLGGAQPPVDYATLREKMAEERMHRVFIKLACGSAASGVIAYQVNPSTGAELAITTVGVESFITRPPIYYNSGKLRRYNDRKTIEAIINWLYRHGAYAEQWVPKASHGGRSFDIRQLVVFGEACHAVARCSTTPITNLHLRSQRMTPVEAGLSGEMLEQVRETARRALAAFPGSRIAGMDVLVSGNPQRTYIADVNPFGDLLYDVEYHGYGTYEWEMKMLADRAQPSPPSTSFIKDGTP